MFHNDKPVSKHSVNRSGVVLSRRAHCLPNRGHGLTAKREPDRFFRTAYDVSAPASTPPATSAWTVLVHSGFQGKKRCTSAGASPPASAQGRPLLLRLLPGVFAAGTGCGRRVSACISAGRYRLPAGAAFGGHDHVVILAAAGQAGVDGPGDVRRDARSLTVREVRVQIATPGLSGT